MSTREFEPAYAMRSKLFTVAYSQPAKVIAQGSGGGGQASGSGANVPKEVVRSFRRLAAILGIGVAAVGIWYGASYAYRRYHMSKDEIKLLGAPGEEADVSAEDTPESETASANAKPIEIILHQCPRGIRSPCISPFPFKLETFLRVAGIPYKVDPESMITFGETNDDENVPWLTINGNDIYDSHQCIPELCKAFGVDLESQASGTRRTACDLLASLLDSKIYWEISYWRWVLEKGNSIPLIQPMDKMSAQLIPKLVEQVQTKSKHNRISRLSPEQIFEQTMKDLYNLMVTLGNHPFFLGPSPGEVDCAAFALLCQMVYNMPDSPLEKGIQQFPRLIKYVERMKSNFWPDWYDILQMPRIEEAASAEQLQLQQSEYAGPGEEETVELKVEDLEADLAAGLELKANDPDDLGAYNPDEEARPFLDDERTPSEMLVARDSVHSVESIQSNRSGKSTTSNGFDYGTLVVSQDKLLKQQQQLKEREQAHQRQMEEVNVRRQEYFKQIHEIEFKLSHRLQLSQAEYAMYEDYQERTRNPVHDQNGTLMNPKVPTSYYPALPVQLPRQGYFGYGYGEYDQPQRSGIPSEGYYNQPHPRLERMQPSLPRPTNYPTQMMPDNRHQSAVYFQETSSPDYRRVATAPAPSPTAPVTP